jgi:hypothetical protein
MHSWVGPLENLGIGISLVAISVVCSIGGTLQSSTTEGVMQYALGESVWWKIKQILQVSFRWTHNEHIVSRY